MKPRRKKPLLLNLFINKEELKMTKIRWLIMPCLHSTRKSIEFFSNSFLKIDSLVIQSLNFLKTFWFLVKTGTWLTWLLMFRLIQSLIPLMEKTILKRFMKVFITKDSFKMKIKPCSKCSRFILKMSLKNIWLII